MTVDFQNFRVNDIAPPVTIEDVFRHYGSFADIHDFQFDSLYTLSRKISPAGPPIRSFPPSVLRG